MPRSPGDAPRWEPILLLVAALLPTLGAWIYFVELADSRWAKTVYGVSKTVQFLLPLVVLPTLLATSRRRERWPRERSVRHGLASGLLILSALVATWGLIVRFTDWPQILGPSIAAKMDDFGVVEPLPYLLLALFISLLHSGLEEYYWRWFLFGRLRDHVPDVWALVLSSLAFASHHVIVVGSFARALPQPALLVPLASLAIAGAGAFWAWQYWRSGALIAPWISHMAADVAIMSIGAWLFWG